MGEEDGETKKLIQASAQRGAGDDYARIASGRRGRDPGAWRHGVRSACDSERPTTVTHGQSWSPGGCRHESARSAFALVRALEISPKLVVRGRIELPTFRFSGRERCSRSDNRCPTDAECSPRRARRVDQTWTKFVSPPRVGR